MFELYVLALHGEVDFSLGEQRLSAELDPLIRFGPEASTIVDLTDVTFADAAFLGALIRCSNAFEDKRPRRRICIVAPRGTLVSRLFEITKLDGIFRVFEDLQSARMYLSSSKHRRGGSPWTQTIGISASKPEIGLVNAVCVTD